MQMKTIRFDRPQILSIMSRCSAGASGTDRVKINVDTLSRRTNGFNLHHIVPLIRLNSYIDSIYINPDNNPESFVTYLIPLKIE